MEQAVQEARRHHLPVRPAHAEPQERQAQPELPEHEHLLPPDVVGERRPDERREELPSEIAGGHDPHIKPKVDLARPRAGQQKVSPSGHSTGGGEKERGAHWRLTSVPRSSSTMKGTKGKMMFIWKPLHNHAGAQ